MARSLVPTRPSAGAVRATAALALLLAVAAAAPAEALRLTFDPVDTNFQPIDPAYGDRVVRNPQDGFGYGTEEGFTPNVVAEYGPIPGALPHLWTVGFGDLVNVLYDDQDGHGLLEITLRADPQWRVALHGFDLAAWSVVAPIRGVQVRRGNGEVLYAEGDVPVPHAGHVHVAFDPPLTAPTLVIAIDSGNLGSLSDDVGIDDIVFGQVVDPLAVEEAGWGRVKARWRP